MGTLLQGMNRPLVWRHSLWVEGEFTFGYVANLLWK